MWRVSETKTRTIGAAARSTLAGLLLSVLALAPVGPAWAQTVFPPAPGGREIALWDGPEGLYERDGNLIVVAVYDERTAHPNPNNNIGVLLGRISSLMQSYVLGANDTKDQYKRMLFVSAFRQELSLLPKGNREVARQLAPKQGRLVLEFPNGVEIISRGRAAFESLDFSKVALQLKQDILKQEDKLGLQLFAARNGEVLDEIRLASATMDPARLFTIAPTTGDALRDRDAVLRRFCSGPSCAATPQTHLADARRNASFDPDVAVVQAILARWTSDPATRTQADALLQSLWVRDAAHAEFFRMTDRCAQTATENPMSLSAMILARCGLYWRADPSAPTEEPSFFVAQAAFKKGEDPQATLQLLLRVVDQNPGQGKAWSYLGSLFLFLKRPVEAMAALHQSVLISPASLDARMNLADAYRSLEAGHLAKALYLDILARADAGATAEFTQDIRGAVTARLAENASQLSK